MILDRYRKNNIIKLLFGAFISLILIYYSMNNFNYDKFNIKIEQANYTKIFFASILLIFTVYIRAFRWKKLFDIESISPNFLYKAEFIGYFGNNILPLRLGEILRTLVVGEKYKIKKTTVLGSIILERILDMFAVGMFVVVLFFLNYKLIIQINYIFLFSLIGMLLIGIIGIIFSLFKKNNNINTKNKFLLIVHDISVGFSKLRNENIVIILFQSFFIWLIYLVQLYLVQDAFNLGLNINQVIIMLLISTASISIPALPGNFGTFEGSIVYSLSLFNISDNFGFGFLLHAISFIPFTFLGLLYFVEQIDLIKNFKSNFSMNNE